MTNSLFSTLAHQKVRADALLEIVERQRAALVAVVADLSRGLVTFWQDGPLLTWEQANEARRAILDYTGEDGEVEEVVLHV